MKSHKAKREVKIRPIEPGDIAVVAEIIRLVMAEFKAVGCGYSSNDAEVDDMHSAYAPEGSAFYVVTLDERVLGCGGFGPLTGGEQDTCELRKMYFKSELRGLGVGTKLLKLCLEEANHAGYRRCYLETKDNMEQARRLYGKHGFKYLDQPLGETGHTSCGTWMARDL
jgi:putative acetyltransferase